MRVTNQTVMRNSVSGLQGNLQAIERARQDIATGIRLRRLSQDPAGGAEVLRVGSSLRAIEQFRRNIRVGVAKSGAEEQVLESLTNSLTRAAELAIQQSSATSNADSRLSAKAELDSILDFVVGLGNTRFGDEYLFAGTRAGEAPFRNPPVAGDFRALLDSGGNPVDPSGAMPVEVGDGRFVTPNRTGTELLLDTNALGALRQLSEALGSNDVPGIQASVDSVRDAVTSVQTLVARQGALVNDLEDRMLALDSFVLTLQGYRSSLRDTEIDKAMVELVGQQTMYQAAMSATSRVLGLSLANYL